MERDFLEDLEKVDDADGRFRKEAYLFVFDALQHTVESLGKRDLSKDRRHVSGKELLSGISTFALDQYGPLTRSVFHHWGLTCTRDFGTIVFNLVDANLMSKTENDTLEDFSEVFNFDEEFDWRRRRAEFRPKSPAK